MKRANVPTSVEMRGTIENSFIGDYRIISVMKASPLGRVMMAIYFRNFWFRTCVLKEAIILDMSLASRTRRERLSWQFELHKRLAGELPVASPIGMFESEDAAYLVLDYVKGEILQDAIDRVFIEHSFSALSKERRSCIISWLLEIVQIIEKMHALGYIHRDISASNFIVSKSGQLYLLDMEMAFDFAGQGRSRPLFQGSTPGYSSPQQLRGSRPIVQDDIYAIGALILNGLAHMHPRTANLKDRGKLIALLQKSIGHAEIVKLIVECLDPTPSRRPELSNIKQALSSFKFLV
ncbi:serine/threonine protein kinase [Chryseolinea soli]|uniref:non-specific serine/threonine protein kinase n=1 Tax=Chryseolinea soli TaxID=2321403 RepID=A0A385SPX7_9BACT|nr:protein kinase [Chryseolinea soli]AYB32015.1 hypothetical protein D4L85_16215 [Chryseolinea soli]